MQNRHAKINNNEDTFQKGYQLLKSGHLKEARAEFAKCQNVKHYTVQLFIARCYTGEGNLFEALVILESIIKKVSTREEKVRVYNQLMHVYSNILKKNINPDLTASYLTKFKNALDNYPFPNDQSHELYKIKYLAAIGEYKDSLKMIDALTHLKHGDDAHSISLQLMKTSIMERSTKSIFTENEAKDLLKECLKPTSTNLHSIHKIALAYPHLIDIKTIKIKPTYTAEDHKLAIIYEKLGMANEAEKEYLNLIQKYPSTWIIHFNYAYFLSENDDTQESNRVLLNIFNMKPKPCHEELVKTYISLAINSNKLNDAKQTTFYINSALALNPQDPTDRARLDSLQAKLIQQSRREPVVTKKSFSLYEHARITDENRWEGNHPSHKPIAPKISTYDSTTRSVSTHASISKRVASLDSSKKPTQREITHHPKKAPQKEEKLIPVEKIQFVQTLQPEKKAQADIRKFEPKPSALKKTPKIKPVKDLKTSKIKLAQDPQTPVMANNNSNWCGFFQNTVLFAAAVVTARLIFGS